ncbi:MAG: hypothetical protein ACO1NQ_11215, partial [Flavobacteriales bacterium]
DLLFTDEAKRTAIPRIARQLPADLPLFMRKKSWPDPAGVQRIAFLHLDIAGLSATPVIERLKADGFVQSGPVQVYDRYELRTFTR